MSDIRSHAANQNYLEGWERIFGKVETVSDWTTGRSILEVRAIQNCAKAIGKSPEETAKTEKDNVLIWKSYLLNIN